MVKRVLVAALLAGACMPVLLQAETFDTCTKFIESVPTTISTQGVYCLRKDLATAQSTGNAITVSTNNVTIDCNGFKIGGLAAGSSTEATGIHAYTRQNVTVRNCNVRGFRIGVYLNGTGHLVGTTDSIRTPTWASPSRATVG